MCADSPYCLFVPGMVTRQSTNSTLENKTNQSPAQHVRRHARLRGTVRTPVACCDRCACCRAKWATRASALNRFATLLARLIGLSPFHATRVGYLLYE
eukprot:6209610-Pleurochrysis_carterae.AAC.3